MFYSNFKEVDYSNATWKSEVSRTEYCSIWLVERRYDSGEIENSFVVNFSLEELRKSEPELSQEYYNRLLKEAVNKIKTKDGYCSSKIKLSPIDQYTDHTDIYCIPVITHNKGDRKLSTNLEECGYIPKGWDLRLTIRFEGEQSNRLRNSILNELCKLCNTELDNSHKKTIKENLNSELQRYHSHYKTRNLISIKLK